MKKLILAILVMVFVLSSACEQYRYEAIEFTRTGTVMEKIYVPSRTSRGLGTHLAFNMNDGSISPVIGPGSTHSPEQYLLLIKWNDDGFVDNIDVSAEEYVEQTVGKEYTVKWTENRRIKVEEKHDTH